MVDSVTVSKGQTLSQIARANGISFEELLKANPQFDPKLAGKTDGKAYYDPAAEKGKTDGRDPDRISIGEKINIPKSANAAATGKADASVTGQTTGAAGAASAAAKDLKAADITGSVEEAGKAVDASSADKTSEAFANASAKYGIMSMADADNDGNVTEEEARAFFDKAAQELKNKSIADADPQTLTDGELKALGLLAAAAKPADKVSDNTQTAQADSGDDNQFTGMP